MITPMIHELLSRDDVARLVAEIAQLDAAEARSAERALQAGQVDAVLDSRVALDAVRGRGGAPAPLPLTLLWYVPIRAALQERGVPDIDLADYTATLPVVFTSTHASRKVAGGETGIALWWRSIASLPAGAVVQAERAADVAALALWWAGCFPEWVARRGGGSGMIRAYVRFAGQALLLAAGLLQSRARDAASLYARAAEHTEVLHSALMETRSDYLGRDVHTPQSRLERFLARLSPDRRSRRSDN